MSRVVRVRCTIEVDVEVPDDWTDDQVHFDIVENHCPGTGRVGSAIEEEIARCEELGICWACPNGKNEILSIDPPCP